MIVISTAIHRSMSKTKTMRLFHRYILLAFVLFVACKQNNRTQIEVNFRNSKTPLEVNLLQQDFDKTALKKSLTLKGNRQNCVFKLKDIQEPTFYQLQLKGEQTKRLFCSSSRANRHRWISIWKIFAITLSPGPKVR